MTKHLRVVGFSPISREVLCEFTESVVDVGNGMAPDMAHWRDCIGPKVMPTRETEKTHFREALNQAFAGELQKAGKELAEGMAVEDNSKSRLGAHSQALNLALVVLALGLMQPFLGLPERIKGISACVLVAGTLMMPVGILVEVANIAAGTSIVMIGGTLAISHRLSKEMPLGTPRGIVRSPAL